MTGKRWELLAALVGLLLIGVGMKQRTDDPQARASFLVQAEGCGVPVTRIEQPGISRVGDAVILHGFGANGGVMASLARELARNGFKAYLFDLSGHGNNTDPFTFEGVERCAAAAIKDLASRKTIDPTRTVLIGHSLGGDIAILVASRIPFAATVAISPGPLVPVPRILDRLRPYEKPAQLPRNLLVLTGDLDLPTFDKAAHQLIESSGGPREEPTDFMAGAALGVRTIPWATHTGLVFRRETAPLILFWFLRIWNSSKEFVAADPGEIVRIALPVGIVLLFPAFATLCAAMVRKSAPKESSLPGTTSPFRALGPWALSAIAVALFLHWFSPLSFLRLATGDYLASFLLFQAALFWLLQRNKIPQLRSLLPFVGKPLWPMMVAAALGLAVMLSLGWAVSGEWGDLWLNSERWWRFAVMAPMLLPYFLVEEAMLGKRDRTGTGRESVRRFVAYFFRRGIMWLAMLAALLLLHGTEILVMVMGLVFIGFSLAQWFAGNAVRRRFACLEATATFNAILAAWFLAAVFPLK